MEDLDNLLKVTQDTYEELDIVQKNIEDIQMGVSYMIVLLGSLYEEKGYCNIFSFMEKRKISC
jgi:hypothetical protein